MSLLSTAAQEPLLPNPIALWPEGQMPGGATKKPEEELPSRGDYTQRLTNISHPEISVFPAPETGKPTSAIVICPGGGYSILSYNKEGTEIAAWLQSIGVTGIVLKYRVPDNRNGAFQDIQRAVRLVRVHAKSWGIYSNCIGVMGFSAGGHLCARLSTNFRQSAYSNIDDADTVSCRPDFAVLVYPAYLAGKNCQLAAELPVNTGTPPTFLVHTEDDVSFVPGSKVYHSALEAAQVSNEFFLCATGGHGYGLRSAKEVNIWPEKCQEWLKKIGAF